jgi:hypothetical protein
MVLMFSLSGADFLPAAPFPQRLKHFSESHDEITELNVVNRRFRREQGGFSPLKTG